MLNIYEGIFKISNPKLYKSPYKANVKEVLKVLKNYRFRSRILFLKNLRTLKIEKVDTNELKESSVNHPIGVYEQQNNKIILSKEGADEDYSVCNHELFHVASTNRKNLEPEEYGNCLKEGITEYLNLKSKNKEISLSGYQAELFVVEFLIYTHGEHILAPYFRGDIKKFFEQFNENAELVREIENLLTLARKKDRYHNKRLKYLYLTDFIPELINTDIAFLYSLNLNYKTDNLINNAFSKKGSERQKRIKKYFDDLDIDTVKRHAYEDPVKKQILKYYKKDYRAQQKDIFDAILYKLMLITKNLPPTKINRIIERCTENKHQQFKLLYEDVINNYLIETKKTR